jgi:hypothetical protein
MAVLVLKQGLLNSCTRVGISVTNSAVLCLKRNYKETDTFLFIIHEKINTCYDTVHKINVSEYLYGDLCHYKQQF